MPALYSHSRLSTFEQCPLKFKFAYIDKIETEIEETIEAFLGSRVHEALEKLYKDLKFQKLNTLKELLGFMHVTSVTPGFIKQVGDPSGN